VPESFLDTSKINEKLEGGVAKGSDARACPRRRAQTFGTGEISQNRPTRKTEIIYQKKLQ